MKFAETTYRNRPTVCSDRFTRISCVLWLFGTGRFQQVYRQWIDEALESELALRDVCWSEAIAVGSLAFAEKVEDGLGVKAIHRADRAGRWNVCTE